METQVPSDSESELQQGHGKQAVSTKLILPKMLECPPKLYPVITEFNKYLYFLLEGGRGSGKTQTVARLLLYIGEKTSADIDRFRRCIIRELCFRKKVYPKWVFQKKMKQEQTDFEIETMEKIKNYFDYLQIHLGPEQRKLF